MNNIEHITVAMPTTKDRQHAAAYLRHLADRIEAEDQTDASGARLRLDAGTVEVSRELDEPVVYEMFPWQRIIQQELGQSLTLRLHWRMA